MAKASTKSPQKLDDMLDEEAVIAEVFAANPEVAEELANLTRGEQIIRLRQRGLLDFDVQ